MFRKFSLTLTLTVLFLSLFITTISASDQKVYDFAKLLSTDELREIESLANHYSEQNEIDIIILTTDNTEGRDVVKYMQDFYDEMGLGYDQPFGDTVILTIDMEHREVYVAGFYKGEEYIDNYVADSIRESITSDLSAGDYFSAIYSYIELTDYYMNTVSIFFQSWFQIIISLIVAGISVGVMAYQSSGRKTTNARTYLDERNSAVTSRTDRFVRTAVTKVKKPSNNSSGGGTTGGGHSHSGSRGSF